MPFSDEQEKHIMKMIQDSHQMSLQAHDAALKSELGLSSHNEICAVRYKHIETAIELLNTALRGIYDRMWSIAGAVLILLITALGGLYVMQKNDQAELVNLIKEQVHNNSERITKEIIKRE